MTIVLKKKGFFIHESVRNKETKEWEEKERKLKLDPSVLKHLRDSFEIEADVTCADLFQAMWEMESNGSLELIEMLTNSNFIPHLKGLNEKFEDKDHDPLIAVEIFKYVEIDNYDDLESYKINWYTGCHGIGKPWRDPNMPENNLSDAKKVALGMNTYAIEFTPWIHLAPALLTLRPKLHLTRTKWVVNTEPKPKRKNLWYSENTPLKPKIEQLNCTYSFQDFLDGIAGELCFFGGPIEQRKQMGIIKERAEEALDPKNTVKL
jgi:hypothetical protein